MLTYSESRWSAMEPIEEILKAAESIDIAIELLWDLADKTTNMAEHTRILFRVYLLEEGEG